MAVALVTGCSSGLGLATAQALAKAGHTVYASARDPGSVPDLQSAATVGLRSVRLDVTKPETAHDAVSSILAREGRLDVLVNNAGVGHLGAVETIPMERVREVFETNVFGVLNVLRAVLPTMRAQRSGTVVNVSSVAARVPAGPVAGIYAASKRALEGISEALAAEVAPLGIRVVLVEPGFCRTGAVSKFETMLREENEAVAGPYRDVERAVTAFYHRMTSTGTAPEEVGAVIVGLVGSPARASLHNVVGPQNEQLVKTARSMTAEEWQEAARVRMLQVMAARA